MADFASWRQNKDLDEEQRAAAAAAEEQRLLEATVQRREEVERLRNERQRENAETVKPDERGFDYVGGRASDLTTLIHHNVIIFD